MVDFENGTSKTEDFNDLFDAKYQQEKRLLPCDIKLILLGDSAVGKSKLVERFLLDDYEERTSSTHALTMYRHVCDIKGVEQKVDIWDTAGQESFNELHPTYYFGAHAVILVFDSSRKITYQNLKNWYKEMRAQCPHIPCMVIANKIDMDEKATARKYKFVEEIGCEFNFVSAADGTNVVHVFKHALEMAADYKQNPHADDFMSEVLDLLKDSPVTNADNDAF